MGQLADIKAQAVLARSMDWTRSQRRSLLSPAEIWNLSLLSSCDIPNYRELSRIRGVSPRTVANQMRSARLKLNASTNLFAVTEALRHNLIPRLQPVVTRRDDCEVIVFPAG